MKNILSVLTATALLVTGAAASAANEFSTDRDQNAGLESQLEAARAKLDDAAREVAELSAKIGKPLMDQFMMFGDGPNRAVIGVQLDPQSGKEGARIREVSPGGPAADAGLRVGDVIVGINGTDVKGDETPRQVLRLMRDVAPDSKVKVAVLRDGKVREFVVTARAGTGLFSSHAPHPPGSSDPHSFDFPFSMPFMIHGPLSDMELATLTPQLGRYFGTDKGVLVVRAPKDDAFKLEDGDVILAIDGREPKSGSHATRILGSYQPGEKVSMKIMRDHKTVTLEATLPENPAMGPGRGPDRPGPDRKVLMIQDPGTPT